MTSKKSKSAFSELGLQESIKAHIQDIQALYLADEIPWVVGYSGGKDSTAVLQLVWMALKELPREKHHKQVHVISTDTLVENPIVAAWVANSLKSINIEAREQRLPIKAHRLTPAVEDSFWVNLIGRGYPAPRHKFRWCTERLKIKPSNTFILNMVKENGEAIVVLGTRKAESSRRAGRMAELEKSRLRDQLSPNMSLPNSFVFSPVENWSNDDVWVFLMQIPNPWGYRNKDLLTMYQGATADGECPLVIDTTTPSCGDSRFGCWVCTLVEQDRSMMAMIQNDAEKEWMGPLLKLRNLLDPPKGIETDRVRRDFRRMSGRLQVFGDRLIHGPYTQEWRTIWLTELLRAQSLVREMGPAEVSEIELITLPELQEIRRLWVDDKHEIEDLLPEIYLKETGQPYPGTELEDRHVFGREELGILNEICDGNELHYQLVRELLDVSGSYRTSARRAGLFEAMESALKRSGFEDVEEATHFARARSEAIRLAEGGDGQEEVIGAVDAKIQQGKASVEEPLEPVVFGGAT